MNRKSNTRKDISKHKFHDDDTTSELKVAKAKWKHQKQNQWNIWKVSFNKKIAYLTHAIWVGNFRRFLSLPCRDIFACLLLQLLRVNLTSFLPPPYPGREGRALRRHFTLLPVGPALKSYVPRKFLRGLGNRIQIGANLVAINYRAWSVARARPAILKLISQ